MCIVTDFFLWESALALLYHCLLKGLKMYSRIVCCLFIQFYSCAISWYLKYFPFPDALFRPWLRWEEMKQGTQRLVPHAIVSRICNSSLQLQNCNLLFRRTSSLLDIQDLEVATWIYSPPSMTWMWSMWTIYEEVFGSSYINCQISLLDSISTIVWSSGSQTFWSQGCNWTSTKNCGHTIYTFWVFST